jgi:hypothetical protein
MEPNVSKKTDEQSEEDLFQLFDQEGIEFWNFLKQHKNRIINMVSTYQAETPLERAAEVEEIHAETPLERAARVEEIHTDTLSNQQQVTTEKKDLKRLRLFVKDYFAEFFLASMSIIGMILAVLYMLAHTWR